MVRRNSNNLHMLFGGAAKRGIIKALRMRKLTARKITYKVAMGEVGG